MLKKDFVLELHRRFNEDEDYDGEGVYQYQVEQFVKVLKELFQDIVISDSTLVIAGIGKLHVIERERKIKGLTKEAVFELSSAITDLVKD